jgi:hypothetical protein
MKKIFKTLALGAGLCLAATANAANIDLNLYGASAQFTFWSNLGKSFLVATYGCDNATTTSHVDNVTGKVHGITIGRSCDITGTNLDTIYFRYSAKASYDGPFAVLASSNPQADLACGSATEAQRRKRRMADETSIDNTGKITNTSKCVDVHIGASDVAGESFVQSSSGQLKGPLGGGAITRSFSAINTSTLTARQPVVVPFGFFADNRTKVFKCVGGTHDGNLCTTATAAIDCGGTGTCTQKVIDDISREMAVQIFGGQAYFWSDFGRSFSVDGKTAGVDDYVVACFRHAGSGTAATLDWAVMNNGKWGLNIPLSESTSAPIVYFNDGSSDMMNCIQNRLGAIGYADADQSISGTVVALKYNGVPGRRNTIRNGNYDFFSNQWLYIDAPWLPAQQETMFNALVTYASNPANLSTTGSLGNKAIYWATKNEMVWNKATDKVYPKYVGATTPQVP